MNIVDRIFAHSDPSAIALIHPEETVSYGQLALRVDEAAESLSRLAARRIALDCPDGIEHIVLALAILRSGKCMVPLAAELSAGERDEILRVTHCQAILAPENHLQMSRTPGTPLFDEASFEALDPAFIRFSSGTTGKSKGVILSHETLHARVRAANRGLGIRPGDRILWILPMAHHFAVSIVLYLVHGATVLLPRTHMAEDILQMAREHEATVIYAAPFHYALLSADASGFQWPGLRLAVSTASPLPESTSSAFGNRFGVFPSQGYGIIEIGLPCLNIDAPETKPLSVGRPQPDFRIDIRNGEIWIQGPGLFDAYLHPWQSRCEVLRDHWFRTGDLGHFDAEGFLYLDGRSNSVINVGGLKCFPEEVEAVLLQHPEVIAARVFGQAQARAGMVPVAEIVSRIPDSPPSVASLFAHCRKSLAAYKVPMDFIFVKALPQTASGKIKRKG